jgi:hypothetical protein
MSCTRSNTREDEPLRPKPKRCCCGNCGAAAALRSSRASTDPGNSAAWRWGAGQGVGAVGPTRRTVEARDPGAGAARRWGTGPRSGRGWAKERAAAAKAAQGQGTGEVSSSVMFYWNLIFLWSSFCRHACSCSHQSLLWAKSKGLISHLEVVIPTGPTIIYIVPWEDWAWYSSSNYWDSFELPEYGRCERMCSTWEGLHWQRYHGMEWQWWWMPWL